MIKLNIIELKLGLLDTNCYIVFDNQTKQGVVIDPGDEASFISEIIERKEIRPLLILATHGHYDHLLGVNELKLIYKIPFAASKKDEFLIKNINYIRPKGGSEYFSKAPKIDKYLQEGDKIDIGAFSIDVLDTPGHTPGGLSYYLKNGPFLFCGDTMFADGSIGRYDFKYSDKTLLEKSIIRLLKLDLKTVVNCGHGDPSTISKIKRVIRI